MLVEVGEVVEVTVGVDEWVRVVNDVRLEVNVAVVENVCVVSDDV